MHGNKPSRQSRNFSKGGRSRGASSGQQQTVRLQKYVAQAGVCSRREAERRIAEGRVRVNGVVVTRLGTTVQPDTDKVEVDGNVVVNKSESAQVYVMLHKPTGVVTTANDPRGRRTVIDCLGRAVRGRVFPVGRLDTDSEGLLLLTNDGEMTYRLTHPSYEVPKTYAVLVERSPTERQLGMLRRGVRLDDGFTAPALVGQPRQDRYGTWVEITIHEGRNRQVRRMMRAVGHRVRRLVRIGFGSVVLGSLAPGRFRFLHPEEIVALSKDARLSSRRSL